MWAREASRLGNAVSTTMARTFFTWWATFQISVVGPVSPEKTIPELPSWMTNPVEGTVWWTGMGSTVRSANSTASPSRKVWRRRTGSSGAGSRVKSGQRRVLKEWGGGAAVTGAVGGAGAAGGRPAAGVGGVVLVGG